MAISKPKRGTTARRRTRPTPKPRSVKPGSPVAPEQVQLVPTKGTPGRGGGKGGESWCIEVDEKRVGIVFINVIDEPPIGRHASIQIFLNVASQGCRIGRVAYRLACEASTYDEIYAHMRKSNVASRRAAEEAGFSPAALPEQPQLVMVRHRGALGSLVSIAQPSSSVDLPLRQRNRIHIGGLCGGHESCGNQDRSICSRMPMGKWVSRILSFPIHGGFA